MQECVCVKVNKLIPNSTIFSQHQHHQHATFNIVVTLKSTKKITLTKSLFYLQHAWVMDHIHPTHAFTMSNVPSTVLKPFKYTVKGKNMID